jgi:hypothetical protein
MIDFSRSSFTWKHIPWSHDPHYKYAGGFVGQEGQVYHVRFLLEAKCEVADPATGAVVDLYAGAPCRSEYTIARRNLFQVPSAEWRLAFSDTDSIPIARRPSTETEAAERRPLTEAFSETRLDVRRLASTRELADGHEIVAATFADELMNARSTYRDADRGLDVTVEFPVNLINVNEADGEFQICTGPVLLPDLATWDGAGVSRVFLAHVAVTAFDWVEFILRREVKADDAERQWLDTPRGRDRSELWDPAQPPAGHPPARPRPTVYNETWELPATNVFTAAPNA